VIDDERREATSRLIFPKLAAGKYEIVVYTHKCVTNIQEGEYMANFDLLFDIAIRTVRIVDGHKGESRTNVVPVKKDG
jgi:hypothetical protein